MTKNQNQTQRPTGSTKSFTPRDDEQHRADIQRRAYELYVERGKEPGHELEDWAQAEREVFERDEGEKIG